MPCLSLTREISYCFFDGSQKYFERPLESPYEISRVTPHFVYLSPPEPCSNMDRYYDIASDRLFFSKEARFLDLAPSLRRRKIGQIYLYRRNVIGRFSRGSDTL